MRAFIQNLSGRAEFVLVTALCFSLFFVASSYGVPGGVREVELSTARAVRGILIELGLLLGAAAVLRVRGWDADRLGLRFSARAAAAGVPLFVLYLLLYWVTATLVLLIWPAARDVWTIRFTVSAPLPLLFTVIVLNSLFEELAVTAYVIAALEREGAVMAITASTLLRFAYHLYQGPLASLSVLPLGLVFAAMFWRWRNVWPLAVAHAIAGVLAFSLNPERPV